MDTHFDKLIDQFENELKSGKSPQIEEFLGHASEESKQDFLEELISLEVFYRFKQTQQVRISDYARFGHNAVIHAELAVEENSVNENRIEPFKKEEGRTEQPQVTKRIDSAIQPDQMVGRYKLLQKIGEGGMGSVWMAEQQQPVRRRVALKFIKSELASKEVIARFEAERQALAMMDHHNIAKVLDAGTTDLNRPFFVMELVKGIPITQYCDENKLSINDRLKLFVPVCKAIQHAHQKGILHRDLKPSNVLVTLYEGEAVPKVIDFGMAKATAHSMKLTDKTMFTEFGKVVGTLQYMSPEQAELNALDVDTQTDIYSLGVMLYELLTGSTPVDKATIGTNAFLQVLEIIREKDPPRPSYRLSSASIEATSEVSLNRKITLAKLQQILKGDLDWVVMKALEKDRTRRYQTANDFAQDISSYLTGDAVIARPPSTGYQIRKFATRNRGLVASILTVGFVLLAGIVGTSYGLIRANQKTSEAEKHQKQAEDQTIETQKEREKAKESARLALNAKDKSQTNERRAVEAEKNASAESRRARDSEANAKFQLANARWDANRVLEARDLLHQIPDEYRDNFEWNFCNRNFLGSDITSYGHTDWVYKVAFSPDGKRLASASRDRTIKIWDAQTGQAITTLRGHSEQVGSVTFSPDNTRIATASFNGTIKLWDTESFEEVITLTGHTTTVATVVFSPNGEQLASASDDKTIKLWDVRSGQEIATFKGHLEEVGSVVFSPDGKRLASASVDKTIKLWDIEEGREITTLSGHAASVISVAFSPDGSRLASGSEDMIKLWDARSFQEIATLRGHTQFVHHVAFSPDGARLASAGRDKMIKLWDVRSGQEIMSFTGHTGWVNGVAFSPDGARLASASFDKTVKLWDARSGQKITSLPGHANKVYSVALSPDGTRIASGSSDTTVKIWDTRSGQEVFKLKGHTGEVYSVAFSPDGMRLASGGTDTATRAWDTQTGKHLATFEGHTEAVNCVAFSPNGMKLVTASDDKTIKLWDVNANKEIATLTGHTSRVNCVAFSHDGKRLATGSSDGTVKLWDWKSRQEITMLSGHSRWIKSVAFSPDGLLIAVTNNNSIKLRDAQTLEPINTLKGHSEMVTNVGFNPNGTRLVSASHDKTIKLWNARTANEIMTLRLSTDRVNSVTFSQDGNRLVSAGTDGMIKLWDARTEHETIMLEGHTDTVARVTFSTDGAKIFSNSWSRENLVWDAATRKPIKDAKWTPPAELKHVSPAGRWLVTGEANKVILVDLEYRNTLQEKVYRTVKARFDPRWHQERARESESEEDWYAAAFHFAWLINNDPEQAEFYDGLQSSHERLAAQFERAGIEHEIYLANVIKDSLEFPRGNK